MRYNTPIPRSASLFILPIILTVQIVALGLFDNASDRAQPGIAVVDPFAARAVAYIRELSENSAVIHAIVHSARAADDDVQNSETFACCAAGDRCPFHLAIIKGDFDMRRIIGSGLSDGSTSIPAEYIAMLFEVPEDPEKASIRAVYYSPDRAGFAKILDPPSPTDCS